MGEITQDNINAPQQEQRAIRTHARDPSHAPPQKRPKTQSTSLNPIKITRNNTNKYHINRGMIIIEKRAYREQEYTRYQKTQERKPKTPKQQEKLPTPKSVSTLRQQDSRAPSIVPLLPPSNKTPRTNQRKTTQECKTEKQTEAKKKFTLLTKKPPIRKTPIGRPVITLTPTDEEEEGRAE